MSLIPDNLELQHLIREHPAFPRPCPACGKILEPGEPCDVCKVFNRIRNLLAFRKGRGRFITESQPQEK